MPDLGHVYGFCGKCSSRTWIKYCSAFVSLRYSIRGTTGHYTSDRAVWPKNRDSPRSPSVNVPKASKTSSSSRDRRGPSVGEPLCRSVICMLSSRSNGCGSSDTAACRVRKASSKAAERARRRSTFLCSSSASASARLTQHELSTCQLHI